MVEDPDGRELRPCAVPCRLASTRGAFARGAVHTTVTGELRELRFYLGRDRTRITYYIAKGRRIILLTVFRKSNQREPAEIDRAERMMLTCIAEGHVAEKIDEQ